MLQSFLSEFVGISLCNLKVSTTSQWGQGSSKGSNETDRKRGSEEREQEEIVKSGQRDKESGAARASHRPTHVGHRLALLACEEKNS